jgi:hypothetical protein
MDLMHLQCGNEAARAWPDVPSHVTHVDGEHTLITTWPASLLSDEWKDFWMECRKRDRAEIDKARGPSPRAVSIVPPDSDEGF